MKKILIVPDIPGWVVESMAFGIIKSLKHKFNFTIKYSDELALNYKKEVIDWKNDIDKYDVIYIMIPGYIPKGLKDYSKIITTFHGGPGTEGQAHELETMGLNGLRCSYVSNQTRDRIIKNSYKSGQKINLPKGEKIIEYCKNKLYIKDNDEIKVKSMGGNKFKVNFTKSFDLHGLKWFTPHGVDVDVFNQDKIHDKFTCGYAGWVRYLMDVQKDHRRGHWILNSWNKLEYNLKIAAGIKIEGNSISEDISYLRSKYVSLNHKLNVKLYEHKKMVDFYSGISCYLVPDKYAGGPVPVLEAGAMGIPVVCTDAGLCGDFIEDMVHGRVIKTYKEFRNTILWMKHNPKERKRMGKNLQEYIRKNRSLEAVSKYWENFLIGR